MGRGFTRAQWEALKARDQHCVWHGPSCDPDLLVPQHRSGRGMGGSRLKNHLSNGVAMCSIVNGLIESDAELAAEARRRGIKISLHADTAAVPVEYPGGRIYYLLDDGTREEAPDGALLPG